MTIKNIENLEVTDMASMAEDRIIDVINLLDGILNNTEIQTKEAVDTVDNMSDLCDIIERAYNRAKSSLNELQQG